jgi:hypothetical protein
MWSPTGPSEGEQERQPKDCTSLSIPNSAVDISEPASGSAAVLAGAMPV